MNLVHYSTCPVCNSSRIDPLLRVKDHSVTKEEFVIWQCSDCSLRFTQDAPDEESIGRYYQSPDYISHSNTAQGFLNKLYQRVRTHTLKQKAKLVESYTKGKLLDVGAGVGAFLSVMKNRGWKTTGIEPDDGARKISKEQYGILLEQPETLFSLGKGSYNAITLWHVLEHVHALHPYVEQLKNLLATDGKLFIAVPNYTSGDAAAYRNYWAAYDVPRHLYHFTPKSIQTLMRKHGLKVKEQKAMWFDAFYISLLSSKYHRGKTSWIGAGINGLTSNLKAVFHHNRCSSIIYVIEKL